jgi:hypothetical protein
LSTVYGSTSGDVRQFPAWRAITCPVGGADISPRRAETRLSDFDPPTVTWLDDGGDPMSAPTFSLGAGEVEMLHLWAYVGDEWVEWSAELLVLVDGNRRQVEITDGGRPFITAGSAGTASQHAWYSWERRWDPPLLTSGPEGDCASSGRSPDLKAEKPPTRHYCEATVPGSPRPSAHRDVTASLTRPPAGVGGHFRRAMAPRVRWHRRMRVSVTPNDADSVR